MLHVCILCATDIANDPRVLRQVNALKDVFHVTVLGFGSLNIEGVRFIPWDVCHVPSSGRREFVRRCISYYGGSFREYLKRFSLAFAPELRGARFDLVLVNEAPSLAPGFLIARGAPVVCDLHENYMEVRHPGIKPHFRARYFRYLCRTYLPQCAAVTTVSEGLVEAYAPMCSYRPVVVPNCPEGESLPVRALGGQNVRLVHHGLAEPARRTHLMVEMMDLVDERYTLDLMLTGRSAYRDKVQKMASLRLNVNWRTPVPMPEICRTINEYDMGVFLAPPTTYNLKYCLPNKFFEFIQARIGVAIGPSIEMVPILRKYGLGVIAQDFSPRSLAMQLNALDAAAIMSFKHNAEKAAGVYNAKSSMRTLLDVIERCLGEGRGGR